MNEENNYTIGVTHYAAVLDSQGYPNGMPHWSELDAASKYRYCMIGIDILETCEMLCFVKPLKEFGTGDSIWGEGECKLLMDYIESRMESEKEAMAKWIKDLNERMKGQS
jgi:hypothetical protein